MTSISHPFLPVLGDDARVLVLGMFPSQASVDAGGYCGHPRNAFWPIMADILHEPSLTWDNPPEFDPNAGRVNWEWRYAVLRLHGVSLWDVVKSCDRSDASSDQGISDVVPADVWTVLANRPRLRGVILNGRAAWDVFREWTLPYARDALRVYVCPSTSPRHAVPFRAKLAAWRKAYREATA